MRKQVGKRMGKGMSKFGSAGRTGSSADYQSRLTTWDRESHTTTRQPHTLPVPVGKEKKRGHVVQQGTGGDGVHSGSDSQGCGETSALRLRAAPRIDGKDSAACRPLPPMTRAAV